MTYLQSCAAAAAAAANQILLSVSSQKDLSLPLLCFGWLLLLYGANCVIIFKFYFLFSHHHWPQSVHDIIALKG